MVRYLVFFNQPDDPEAFDKYYREVHMPLVKALPHLRRYSLARSIMPLRGDPMHLVAMMEYDDMATLKESFASPAGEATSRDVPNLAPVGKVHSMIYEVEDVDLGADR